MHDVEMHGVATTPTEDQETSLLDEIAILERRLLGMGIDGDCAYERAMSRVYTRLIEKRKLQLVVLRDALSA